MEEAGQLVKEAAVVDLPADLAVISALHLFAAGVAVAVVVRVGVVENGRFGRLAAELRAAGEAVDDGVITALCCAGGGRFVFGHGFTGRVRKLRQHGRFLKRSGRRLVFEDAVAGAAGPVGADALFIAGGRHLANLHCHVGLLRDLDGLRLNIERLVGEALGGVGQQPRVHAGCFDRLADCADGLLRLNVVAAGADQGRRHGAVVGGPFVGGLVVVAEGRLRIGFFRIAAA